MVKRSGMLRGKDESGVVRGKRHHHYEFAHVALPHLCFDDPLGFFSTLASPEDVDFIGEIWAKVCQICDPVERIDFSTDDTSIHRTRMKGYPALIFQMPEPKGIAEAFFVCFILRLRQQDLLFDAAPEVDCYTLEYTVDIEDGRYVPCTILAGWTRDGTHFDFGEGPEAELGEFIRAVEERI
ncbi:hypothetical protein ACFL0Q_07550 [Thermodesulfobacteriota bacterium]